MKALTIWQPFGTLAVSGIKKDETRSWATYYRGPLLIHSAKKSFETIWFNDLSSDTRIEICNALDFNSDEFDYKALFPTGVILG